ncbi:uncharacterized protein DS421_14g469480 [Arachis hypogaea]|nr:uncharacterized protein DS421_14g469480 [Arachis hypogaea]
MRGFAALKYQRFKKTAAKWQGCGNYPLGRWCAVKLLEFTLIRRSLIAPFIPPTHTPPIVPYFIYASPFSCSQCLLPTALLCAISFRVVMVFRAVTVAIALHAVCSCHHPPRSSHPLTYMLNGIIDGVVMSLSKD